MFGMAVGGLRRRMGDDRLALELFGSFRAAVDGTPLTGFRSDKARALLAYLAVEGDRPHARSTLATLLWPDMLDEAARGNLRKTLHRLQETLSPAGEPVLLVTRQTIALNRAACCTDVTRFRELLAATAAHRHATLHACDDCVQRLVQAVALYRGELLAGFSLPAADPFDEWLMLRRERFLHAALGALYRLTAADLERGQYDQALAHAVRQVELDPGREEAYRQAIRALLLSGQRTQARAYLERAGQMLRAVLGVELSPETLALLDDEEREVRGAAPPRQAVRRAVLPVQLPPLVGRKRERADTAALLDQPGCCAMSSEGLSHRVGTEIEIDVPIEQVFSYVTDPNTHALWHQVVSEVHDVSGPAGVGQRFTWSAHFLGKRFEVTHEVTDFEPNAVIAWRAVHRSYHGAQHFHFEQRNGGTRVTVELRVPNLHYMGKLAEPVIVRAGRRYQQDNLETLKDLLELHGPDHPR
jgi:DNA-binding SARP family transcriptional activator/uncharacterized protein YndB with AHSA1/START domain